MLAPVKSKISELEKLTNQYEKKIKSFEEVMSSDEFYKGNHNVIERTNEYNSLKEKLKNVYLQWEEETEKLASLEKQSI